MPDPPDDALPESATRPDDVLLVEDDDDDAVTTEAMLRESGRGATVVDVPP